VTVSFFTREVGAWLEHAEAHGVPIREPGLTVESGRVDVFVGYDPGGYFLEWDTFRDVEANRRLLDLLASPSTLPNAPGG
jgi:hypothetical protein